jgi:hypothetical protein
MEREKNVGWNFFDRVGHPPPPEKCLDPRLGGEITNFIEIILEGEKERLWI